LQQFHIRAAVLNAELPLNSRLHILEEYNRGVFDYLIATDESVDTGDDDESDDDDEEVTGEAAAEEDEEGEEGEEKEGDEDDEQEDEDDEEDDEEEDEEEDEQDEDEEEAVEESDGDDPVIEAEATTNKRQKRKRGESAAAADSSEYGVSRGIDFQGVAWVVNFDFPLTSAAYTHRIGRTARGGAKGTALSFVSTANPQEWETLEIVRSQQPALPPVEGDDVLAAISTNDADAAGDVPGVSNSASLRAQPAPLSFNMKELDAFRYRTEDVLRSVTTTAIKELRAAELRQEIMNSDKLQTYFQENPDDLKILRHDRAVAHPIRQLDHLKHLPSYLIPKVRDDDALLPASEIARGAGF
jgi:ATP-dependent RNA helicase DDX56/DBP9